MKRSTIFIASCGILGAMLPMIALATPAFVGPTTQPPLGNVDGVIWNNPSKLQSGGFNISGAAQSGALSVSGSAVIGGDTNVQTITTKPNLINYLLGNNRLQSGDSFQVNTVSPGASVYSFLNRDPSYASALNQVGPLTVLVNGALKVMPTQQTGPGTDGSVQAKKFCFSPGAASDCLTAWPPVGSYVSKAGDSMTGGLTISTNTPNSYGVNSSGSLGNRFSNTTDSAPANEVLIGGPNSGNNAPIYINSTDAGFGEWIHPNNDAGSGLRVDLKPTGTATTGILIGTAAAHEATLGLVSYANKDAVVGDSLTSYGGKFTSAGALPAVNAAGLLDGINATGFFYGGTFGGAAYGLSAAAITPQSGTIVGGSFNGLPYTYSTGTGISANGGSVGGYFNADSYWTSGATQLLRTGAGVVANGGADGGLFVGGTNGVEAFGAGAAVKGTATGASGIGGNFTSKQGDANGIGVQGVANGGTAGHFSNGSSNIKTDLATQSNGLDTDGNINGTTETLSSTLTASGDIWTYKNLHASGNLTVNGTIDSSAVVSGVDISTSNNKWGNPSGGNDFKNSHLGPWVNLNAVPSVASNHCGSWQTTGDSLGSDGWMVCPQGTYLAGIKKASEKITNLVCCDL